MKIKVKIVKKSDNSEIEVEMTPKEYKRYFNDKYGKVKKVRKRPKKKMFTDVKTGIAIGGIKNMDSEFRRKMMLDD